MSALAALITNWRWLAGAALLAAAGWWHAGQVDSLRESATQGGRTEIQNKWDAERRALAAAAAQAEQQNQAAKDRQHEAIHTAQTHRAAAAQRDQSADAALVRERDGLRRDLATALNTIRHSCDLPAAATPAGADRGPALAAVFEELERQGAAMARAASGHAADSLMYQQAWPR